MNRTANTFRKLGAVLGALLLSTTALATDISQVPLEVQAGVQPNITLTMDDSGSMAWAYLPDSVGGYTGTTRIYSSTFNYIYFDPSITYFPAVDQNNGSLGDQTYTAAHDNGFFNSTSCTVDLSSNFLMQWGGGSYCSAAGGQAAYYYKFDTSKNYSAGVACDINNTTHVDSDTCYTLVQDNNVAAGGAWTATQRTNFANWYSYYRYRHLLAKSAASRSFAKLGPTVRVAWQALNTSTTIGLHKAFTGTNRTNFFNWLYNVPANNTTPLNAAMTRAGKDYSDKTNTGINSPYAKDPGVDATRYSCRQNFHVMFTDGYYNDAGTQGNVDGPAAAVALPSNPLGITTYLPNTSPNNWPKIYGDSFKNTLADTAMYYWINDLVADANNVPSYLPDTTTDITGDGKVDNQDLFWNPVNDPANWQHMVNFTVGLGVSPATPTSSYDDLMKGNVTWTNDEIDQLWHSAINTRGKFFSAKQPNELVTAFGDILNSIGDRIAASSAVALDSGYLSSGSQAYLARYTTSDWSGTVIGKQFTVTATPLACKNTVGNIVGDGNSYSITTKDIWDASTLLTGPTGRTILSYNTATKTGITFDWNNVSAAQQTLLNKTSAGVADTLGSDRVNYLKGDSSKEQKNVGGIFRTRKSLLGDMIHSDPVVVGPASDSIRDYEDIIPYSSYKKSTATRTSVVYVGANDGMLHGFDTNSGTELMAYVPGAVYANLPALTDVNYATMHKFYVDGSPSTQDVVYGNSWHSVLAGGLSGGGRGIYVLDITSTTFTPSSVLWEFTADDDPDLGYTYSKPRIIKLNAPAGKSNWGVTFGNGYNNSLTANSAGKFGNGHAILYVKDVQTGALIAKLDTGVGTTTIPNGLSNIALMDTDGNLTVDYVYAGDVYGNMWKFDLSDPNPLNWHVASSGAKATPLFTAKNDAGQVQPITAEPTIGFHSQYQGYMVFFGTGSFLGDTDRNTQIQSFYGVWDRDEASITNITRSNLAKQAIASKTSTVCTVVRDSSANPVSYYNQTSPALPKA